MDENHQRPKPKVKIIVRPCSYWFWERKSFCSSLSFGTSDLGNLHSLKESSSAHSISLAKLIASIKGIE
jgi:hypothetical protein